MKIGLANNFANPWERPWKEVWSEGFELAVLADELGYDYFTLNEHFFESTGNGVSPAALLSVIADRTTRIRIGTNINILPLRHAAHLAQELAVLDNLSDGRLEVVVGAGATFSEYAAFGMSLRTRPSRMDEGLAVLLGSWTNPRFSFSGRYYQLDGITVRPEPFQKPHPPLWVAGMTAASSSRAGRFGTHLSAVNFDPAVYHAYGEALRAAGHDRAGKRISMICAITATREDAEEMWARNRPYYASRWQYQLDSANQLESNPELDFGFQGGDDPFRAFEFIGTPDQVIAELDSMRQRAPLSDVFLFPSPPGMAQHEVHANLQLFAEEVLPVAHAWPEPDIEEWIAANPLDESASAPA